MRIYSIRMTHWFESAILTDRKSKFQARCCRIKNFESVPRLLQELRKDNKSVSNATHKHIFAWRTGSLVFSDSIKLKKSKKIIHIPKDIQQGSNDCGEAGGGQRLLTLLEKNKLINVIVIVTRWHGGVELGSARFRHITSTAVESLIKGNFLP